MSRPNRFAGLETALQNRAEPVTEVEPPTREPPAQEVDPAPVSRAGRKRTGKRSDPAYRPVTFYVKEATYEQVHAVLSRTRGRRFEVSDLVQELFERYLAEEARGG